MTNTSSRKTETYTLEGNHNLELLENCPQFSNWLFSNISPYLKGTILEIGSGIGTYSKMVVRDFPDSKTYLSDIDPDFLKHLFKKFRKNKNIEVEKINLEKEEDFNNIPSSIDSAFAINVLEHIKQDVTAMRNIQKKLTPGGHLVMLVPAHKFLYNNMDRAVGHYRRYSKKMIHRKAKKAGLKVKRIFYFNFLSILGWFVNGNIFKQKSIESNSLKVFEKIVPVLKPIEKHILRNKIGISIIAVLEK